MEHEVGYHEMIQQHTLEFLQTNNVPIETWGKAGAKTIDDLVEEIVANECDLECEQVGEVVRKNRAARVRVYITVSGQGYELFEEYQIMPDGARRSRSEKFGGGIGEKLTINEDPEAGAVRGLEEELFGGKDIGIQSVELHVLDHHQRTTQSTSYPGLANKTDVFVYAWNMPEELYKEDGYVETKPNGQQTFFKWHEIIPNS